MKIAFFNLNCILRDSLLSSKIVSMSECLICSCNACYKSSYIHKSFVHVSGNVNSFFWVSSLPFFLFFPPPLFPPILVLLPLPPSDLIFFFLLLLVEINPNLPLIIISLAGYKRQSWVEFRVRDVQGSARIPGD